MRTTVTLRNHSMTIAHEPCSFLGTPAPDILFLKAEDSELNTLTRIEIQGEQLRQTIYLHWSSKGENLEVLLVEETATLFIGAGTFSASVDLQQMRVVHENVVFLFWGYQHVREWVMELGELECFLYDRTGRLLASVPVDPPYEYFETETGIRFEADVSGTHWLYYPT